MARLAPLQPVSSHPEVSLAAEQSGAAAQCTMSRLARTKPGETINYNQSPFVFGSVELSYSPKDEPFLQLDEAIRYKVPIFLRTVRSTNTLLDLIIGLLADTNRERTEITDTCRALRTILPNTAVVSAEVACSDFYDRNKEWEDR